MRASPASPEPPEPPPRPPWPSTSPTGTYVPGGRLWTGGSWCVGVAQIRRTPDARWRRGREMPGAVSVPQSHDHADAHCSHGVAHQPGAAIGLMLAWRPRTRTGRAPCATPRHRPPSSSQAAATGAAATRSAQCALRAWRARLIQDSHDGAWRRHARIKLKWADRGVPPAFISSTGAQHQLPPTYPNLLRKLRLCRSSSTGRELKSVVVRSLVTLSTY